MNKLEIGTTLYKKGFLTLLVYEITGIRTYENHTQYQATCKSCSHGFQCDVLLGLVGKNPNHLEFIGVINDPDEDAEWESQHMNHNMEGNYYFSKEAVLRNHYNQLIREKTSHIKEKEQGLKSLRNDLAKLEDKLSLINEVLEETKGTTSDE